MEAARRQADVAVPRRRRATARRTLDWKNWKGTETEGQTRVSSTLNSRLSTHNSTLEKCIASDTKVQLPKGIRTCKVKKLWGKVRHFRVAANFRVAGCHPKTEFRL